MIHVRGITFTNKGSELMLRAILQQLGNRQGPWRFVVEPSVAPYEERARVGLFQLMNNRRYGWAGFLIDLLMHQGYRRKYGLVRDEEIDAVLDASGYAYGDPWGPRPAERMAESARRWKSQGKPVILLPQAVGPFSDPRTRAAFLRVLENSDLVFVRDRESLGHVEDLGGSPPASVRRMPDFTNLVEGRRPDSFEAYPPRVCILLNFHMIQRNTPELGQRYFSLLGDCARWCHRHHLEPFVLLHETTRDETLAREFQQGAGTPVQILRENDPVLIKGILGACHAVVGSRYHGLASALSQAVPSVAIGWSHKYAELLADYDCPECLVKLDSYRAEGDVAWEDLIGESVRARRIARLRERADILKQQTRDMWAQVETILNRCSGAPS